MTDLRNMLSVCISGHHDHPAVKVLLTVSLLN